MKTLVKITSALILFFIVSISNAATPLVSLLAGEDPKTFVLNFNSESSKSTLKLTNEAKETFLVESVSDGTFNRKLNLQNLQAGTYFFTAANDKESVVYTIEVTNTSARIIDRTENQNQILFREVGELVQVNLFNPGSENVYVEIVNEDGMKLFEETIKNKVVIGKQINFEKAIKGAYTISLTDGKSYHYHTIEVL